MPLSSELFDYDLPPRLIARTPAERRDRSRLLVVRRADRTLEHRVFSDLPSFLRPGDTLFRNLAAVLAGRLRARDSRGRAVECLLLEPAADGASPSADRSGRSEVWRCLLKPGRNLPPGGILAHPDGAFRGEVLERDAEGVTLVRFGTGSGRPLVEVAAEVGESPVPPYLGRRNARERELDRERYQTVYADRAHPVAAAAPTAGLHFTPELLAALAAGGVRTADLTLRVGLGTFRPIMAETVESHRIHREGYEIPPATQRALFPPLAGRRIAVGTTATRAIEDFLSAQTGPLDRPHAAEAGIYLYPPCRFYGVDALLTNFHQPRSTLLCLVAAFLAPGSLEGIGWLKAIYAEAIALDYRFFSYGDAMLIL